MRTKCFTYAFQQHSQRKLKNITKQTVTMHTWHAQTQHSQESYNIDENKTSYSTQWKFSATHHSYTQTLINKKKYSEPFMQQNSYFKLHLKWPREAYLKI